jgi:ferredoxin-NADP reductase
MLSAEPFDARLVASRSLSPGVREMVFERSDGKVFHFEPGQWVNLVLPLAPEEVKRAYSIASAPIDSTRFEVAVTRVTGGPGSEFLHQLPEGSMLRAIGPHGLFTRAPLDEAPALFVATGTGVTPLRSMLQASRRAGARAPIWLLFGARFEEDILYRDEFEPWARAEPSFRFEVTLSQPRDAEAAGRAWTGRRGYVQHHVPELYRELAAAAAPALPHVYICGLERMVKSVKELVRGELGVDRKHVHTERYD